MRQAVKTFDGYTLKAKIIETEQRSKQATLDKIKKAVDYLNEVKTQAWLGIRAFIEKCFDESPENQAWASQNKPLLKFFTWGRTKGNGACLVFHGILNYIRNGKSESENELVVAFKNWNQSRSFCLQNLEEREKIPGILISFHNFRNQ